MRAAACVLVVGLLLVGRAAAGEDLGRHLRAAVARFEKAVVEINDAHVAKPGDTQESELAKRIPARERATLDRLLEMKDGREKRRLLLRYAEAASSLDLAADLARIDKAAEKLGFGPFELDEFGHYISRPRFLLHARRVNRKLARQFADVLDGILDAYAKVFGLVEFSKVPGKKIRVLLHGQGLDSKPPHFAPQFPYHSQIDFPVRDGPAFASPTGDGKFQFYGLCHELGHLIAMWGDRKTEDDHHAWAHYTGIVIVEACKKAKWAKRFNDERWRSLTLERKKLAEQSPDLCSRDGVLRLLIDLHDLVGPKTIGETLNLMAAKRWGHRINHVRYYWLKDFEKALLALKLPRRKLKKIRALFAEAR